MFSQRLSRRLLGSVTTPVATGASPMKYREVDHVPVSQFTPTSRDAYPQPSYHSSARAPTYSGISPRPLQMGSGTGGRVSAASMDTINRMSGTLDALIGRIYSLEHTVSALSRTVGAVASQRPAPSAPTPFIASMPPQAMQEPGGMARPPARGRRSRSRGPASTTTRVQGSSPHTASTDTAPPRKEVSVMRVEGEYREPTPEGDKALQDPDTPDDSGTAALPVEPSSVIPAGPYTESESVH
ncbi:hypothetical protein KIPB_005929 [Kipferlia bialata]|uniref:Uncharacterized protein n=1 Tax=Kipferlia bialata TaxID=797122 RepID=A0A391NM20_9EUKA|nr:hypothetical protein KIPB_005929 [Kipferlia bialata]|eukprot:g5929.t1